MKTIAVIVTALTLAIPMTAAEAGWGKFIKQISNPKCWEHGALMGQSESREEAYRRS